MGVSLAYAHLIDSSLNAASNAHELYFDGVNLTIPEIAHEVGFNSQSHLTTQFKRIVGVTPGRYRSNEVSNRVVLKK